MKSFPSYLRFLLLLALLYAGRQGHAQYRIQGHVYDSSRLYPLQSVSVIGTNGAGTVTDSNGHYTIYVGEKDSIQFSYLGKPTVKFPILKIADVNQFDIALQVNIQLLKEVKVRPRDYRQDSIQNRKDYAKVFDFRKPNAESITSIGPAGAGIDIGEVIRSFQFRKNRNMMHFQERLLQQERDKSVDHRFSKALVRRLTGLTGEELDRFMLQHRPTYEFTQYSNDYDFQLFIKQSFEIYKRQQKLAGQ
ncbi:carboxypeptidase-like regulatory domain-containing protein [Paraflavisolibacter sp. H34]|uniref:carboxypeptidase-like regulatory domain-containing protein n=1 Tax=Huijunlia imazamoxiresistens TaxID=3127457 RepID=UPI003017461D